VALGMQAGLAELGRLPGRDVFLVGFDDIEEARLAYPPLTTVRCDVARFGRLSAAMLLDHIDTGVAPTSERRLNVELIVRQSSQKPGN
jgi:LacI family transcriptional regulator